MALARARGALAAAGLPVEIKLERASSVTNEVWLSDDFAVRINRQPNQRLWREAIIGPLLPTEVGYPTVVAYGGEVGKDWLISRRVSGQPLSRCWPTMTSTLRRQATRELANKLQSLHQFEGPDDLPEIDTPQLLDPHTFRAIDPLLVGLAKAATLEHVPRHLIDQARSIVFGTSSCIEPYRQRTFIHGDLSFENMLWDGEHLTALVDFEFSRRAPNDVDLDVLLRFCAFPFLHVAQDYEHETHASDYAEVPYWIVEDYPAIVEFDQQFERLRLYSIAYDVREILNTPPTKSIRSLAIHHPLRRLERTIDGMSHLDRLVGEQPSESLTLDQLKIGNPTGNPTGDAAPGLGRLFNR